MNKILLTITLLIATLTAGAQQLTFSGKVIDATGLEVIGGNVTIKGQAGVGPNIDPAEIESIDILKDASRPANLRINSRKSEAVLSYGSENPLLGGEVYPREYAQSSLLYDEAEGEYRVTEQCDHLPASTRAVK